MAIIRVNKTKDYSVMSNYHFKDKSLSLKAKGLLSQMLSLPDNWDYSITGLVTMNKEGKTTIQAILKELEDSKYLVRTRIQNEKGQFSYIYDIYENPYTEKPYTEKPYTEKPYTDNQSQYNTNNKKLNNKKLNIYKKEINKEKRFIKPTIEEIQEYCNERNNGINANAFYDFYESKNWYVGKNKMKDWKACVRTWEQRQKPNVIKETTEDMIKRFRKEIENERRTN